MKFQNSCLGVLAIIIAISIENVESEVKDDFPLTFEGFLPLVDEDYRLKAMKNTEIYEKISLSMYRYYMVQHLYARLALIRQTRDFINPEEDKFSKSVYSTSPLLPRPISKYLCTIGDIELKESINVSKVLKYAFLMWPNSEGHFGRIDATNHWKYMSLPAPSIVAQAIQEDYSYSVNQSARDQTFWNLKQHLVPDDNVNAKSDKCKSPGLPTQNLLGWKPYTELTPQQRRILQSCAITNHIFDTVNSRFYLNPCLLRYVHTILHEQWIIFDFVEATPVTFFQSKTKIRLLSWLTAVDNGSDTSFSRTAVHTDQDFELHMPGIEDDSEGISAMAFRVKKGNGVPTWSIYDWSGYQCVPESWVVTSNTVLDYYRIKDVKVQTMHNSGREALRMKFLEQSHR